MADEFDPYLKWLAIRDPQRPPNHYALLALELFEGDADVVSNAADARMSHVRTFATGPHGPASQRMLNELAAARICLLNPANKAAYDGQLRQKLAPRAGPPAPPPPSAAIPVRAAPALRPVAVAAPAAPAAEPEVAFDLGSNGPMTNTRPRRRAQKSSLGPVLVVGGVLGAAVIVGVAMLSSTPGTTGPAATVAAAPEEPATEAERPAQPDPPTAEPTEPTTAATESEPAPPSEPTAPVEPSPVPPVPVELAPVEGAPQPETADVPPGDPPPAPAEPEPMPPETQPVPPAVAGLMPPPDADAQRAAEAEVRDAFAADFANANTPEAKLRQAEKLLQAGRDAADRPDRRYVLFELARKLAVEGDGAQVALAAVEEQSALFQVDAARLKQEVFEQVALKLKSPEAVIAHIEVLLHASDEAVAADDYGAAQDLLRQATALTRRAGDDGFGERVKARAKDAAECTRQYKAAERAMETLAADSGDAAANFAVGRFEAVYKRQWEKALAHLAAGDHDAWRESAQKDQANPSGAAEMAAAGDAWWDLAKTARGFEQSALRQRAAGWYERAIPQLAGLDRARLQSRITELFGGGKIWSTSAAAGGQELGSAESPILAAFTIEFWFTTSTSDSALLTRRWGGGGGGRGFRPGRGGDNGRSAGDFSSTVVVSGGRLRAWVGNYEERTELDGPEPANDGNWHHAALVGDPTTLRLFLDGRLVGEGPAKNGFRATGTWILGTHPYLDEYKGPADAQYTRIRVSSIARYRAAFDPQRDYGRDKQTVFFE